MVRLRSFFKVIVNVLILQSILYLSIFLIFYVVVRDIKRIFDTYLNSFTTSLLNKESTDMSSTVKKKQHLKHLYKYNSNNNIVLDPFLVFFILTFRHSSPHLVWHIFYNIQMVSPRLVNPSLCIFYKNVIKNLHMAIKNGSKTGYCINSTISYLCNLYFTVFQTYINSTFVGGHYVLSKQEDGRISNNNSKHCHDKQK